MSIYPFTVVGRARTYWRLPWHSIIPAYFILVSKDQAAAQPEELEARGVRPVATAPKVYKLVRVAPLDANAPASWKSWLAPVGALVAAGTGLGLGAEAALKTRDFDELAGDSLDARKLDDLNLRDLEDFLEYYSRELEAGELD